MAQGTIQAPGGPTLSTARLSLQPLREAHAEGLHPAFTDPGVMHYWDLPVSRSLDETRRRIRFSMSFSPDWHRAWVVTAAGSGTVMGLVNYHHRESWNARLEIGYLLGRRYWGRGLMAEAVARLVAHCFEDLGTHRIEATIEPTNLASIRVAERLGFRQESGLLRDRLLIGGEPRSVMMYALLKPDWAAARRAEETPRPRE